MRRWISVRATSVAPDRPARRRVRRTVRLRNFALFTLVFAVAFAVLGGSWVHAKYERYEVTRVSYEATMGRWDIVATSPVRSIHAVDEPITGNILLMAGTGNS